MKAVVMAGGEGTRLRPMTSNMPKPLLPVVNRPVMEHVLRLLKRHALTETVVTVQFLAAMVRDRFGDGQELGMSLTYAAEEVPLGTAGSVKNAGEALRDDAFLVISGDALTDIDLTALIAFHRARGAMVTVCLTRVPDPLEFGITIAGDDGRVERFLEKPTWGQVFSDTVNTGIYVMEPEVLDYVAAGESVDWAGDVFPRLLQEGKPVYGYVADGYWEDIGTHASYLKAQADVLRGKVDVGIDGFERSPGVWVAAGAEVDPDAVLHGPVYIGQGARVEAGARIGEHTVLGCGTVVRAGAFLDHAVVHDNVYIGALAHLRGCVVGRNSEVMRGARIGEGTVVGDACLIGQESVIAPGVRVYPFRTVEAGAFVNASLIWESAGHEHLFGARGVSGVLNVEITPELAVRLAGAYAATVGRGGSVTVARDHSRGARALQRAVVCALQTGAVDVRDLENVPLPVARQQTACGSAGGIMLRTTPGVPDCLDILFFDGNGADLSQAGRRRLERVHARQEYRRAFPGEIGELTRPGAVLDSYTDTLLRAVDLRGVAEAGLRIVVDTANGSAALVLPAVLGRLPVEALALNPGLDRACPTETAGERRAGLRRLGEAVAGARAAFGVRFDPVGERVWFVDERGRVVGDDRALLVLLDLVAGEGGGGRVVLPVTTTRVAERVAARHGVRVAWSGGSAAQLAAAAAGADVRLAGDGLGGFVVPECGPGFDGVAAFVRLTALVARAGLPLGELEARIPRGYVHRQEMATPWAVKGLVMRSVVEAAGGREVDTTEGVRVVEPDGSWALVLPDPVEAVTHVWAEGPDFQSARNLVKAWTSELAGLVR